MSAAKPSLIFSVDVEDWPQSSWDRRLPIGEYCADNTRRLLDRMADVHAVQGTFFVLGKFAEKHPGVVRQIHTAGYEVACHGYGHEEIFQLDRRAFVADLDRATGILGNLIGEQPRGYRAPDFSIVGESLWALDVLAEMGYVYDSSIFPLDRGRYGIQTWPTQAVVVKLDNGMSITEFPLTVTTIFGRRRPISGGGYARLLPRVLLQRWLRAEATDRKIPPVFYCHPYELDPDEFRRISEPIPLKVRLHQGIGRRGLPGKLKMLFRQFECCSFAQVLDADPDIPRMDYRPFKIAPGTRVRPSIF